MGISVANESKCDGCKAYVSEFIGNKRVSFGITIFNHSFHLCQDCYNKFNEQLKNK